MTKEAKKPKYKIYEFSYEHGEGGTPSVLIAATSKAEAIEKFEALKATGRYYGEREAPLFDSERCEEFDQLEKLVSECQLINGGNCIIERLTELIEIAKKLDGDNWKRRRPSFMSLLKDVVINERFVAAE